MNRIKLFIVLSCVCIYFFGCGTLAKLDGTSEKDIKKSKMSKDQMREEIQKLEAHNRRLKEENEVLVNENKKIDGIKGQIKELIEENERLSNEKKSLETKIAWQNVEKEELEKKLSSSSNLKDIGKLKIKVLTGDGNLASAQNMANRMKQMGYQIKMIDRAPKATFLQDTVYFTSNVKKDAKALAARLGGSAVLKPLSWSSEFNIIVVTGKSD